MPLPDLPPHAYVPGQNARHPEDWFDTIKASVTSDLCADQLQETAAFRTGLIYLHHGFHWECHEVLEAVWMQTPDPSPEREMCQALIQLANARLKAQMHKPRAVERLCDMVAAHLERCPAGQAILGLEVAQVRGWLEETRRTR